MIKHRVVITGIGALTPCGVGWKQLWQKVLAAESANAAISRFDPDGLKVFVAAEIPSFNIEDFLVSKHSLRLDRSSQFALAAGQLAFNDATLNLSKLNGQRCGIFDGTSLGALASVLEEHRCYLEGQRCRGGPGALVFGMTGSSSAALAEHFDLHSTAETLALGSVSSSTAIGRAFGSLQCGEIDIAIAGGCEAPIYREIMLPFIKAGVLSRRSGDPAAACRPFAVDRDGFVMGEGAVYLVLEDLDHAIAREAKIYCEIVGFAQTVDAFHPTTPAPSGFFMANAITSCLTNAGKRVTDVNYVNLHGTATNHNDRAEAAALKLVFGDTLPWCSSTKPVTGHLLGACGAAETAISALAVNFDMLPQSLNASPVDPQCGLKIISEKVISEPVTLILNINNSFGGRNSAIALQKYIMN